MIRWILFVSMLILAAIAPSAFAQPVIPPEGMSEIEFQHAISAELEFDLTSIVAPDTVVVTDFCYQSHPLNGCLGRMDLAISISPHWGWALALDYRGYPGFSEVWIDLEPFDAQAQITVTSGVAWDCSIELQNGSASTVSSMTFEQIPGGGGVEVTQYDVAVYPGAPWLPDADCSSLIVDSMGAIMIEIDAGLAILIIDSMNDDTEGGNTPMEAALETVLDPAYESTAVPGLGTASVWLLAAFVLSTGLIHGMIDGRKLR